MSEDAAVAAVVDSASDQHVADERIARLPAGIRPAALADKTLDEVWLLGQPPLSDYLHYVQHKVVDGDGFDRAALADEWRAANDYYQHLSEEEEGVADEIEVRELDPALTPLVVEVMADCRFRRAYDTFPARFAMVELDRLVLFQIHVTHQFVESLKSRLGPAPDLATLFRFCLPPERPEVPVQIRSVGSKRYVFTSESTDFRPHEPVLLRPDQISGHETFGPVAGVVGLVVGFGSNYLTAIRYGDRLVLYNGYHRACAMRALGITHAPCIVETVTRRDELEVAARGDISDDPAFYFRSARPPLLKDFFDPRIRKVLPVYRTLKTIEVNFEIREHYVRI